MPRTLALLWTTALLIGLSIPGDQLPEATLLTFDKVIHVLLFAGLGFLWLRAYPHRAVTVLLLGIAFGLFSEVYQHLMPIERSFSLLDALADAVGIMLAGAVWWAMRRHRTAGESG